MCHGGTLLDLPYEVDFDELADNMAPSGRGPQDGHGLVVRIVIQPSPACHLTSRT
jgi:hypothetical protein